MDGTPRQGGWRLDRGANPDIFTVEVGPAQTREVCFVAGERSLCREVKSGDRFDFVIAHEGFDYPTRIETRPPAAVFDVAYQTENRGRTQILVPEVYELVNIVLAITPSGRDSPFLMNKRTWYYSKVMEHFTPYSSHPLIAAIDADLKKNELRYHWLKMNGYAFEFDDGGRIVRSPVYDRTGFNGGANNDLLPYLEMLRSFADESGFREFYRDHRPVYAELISYFQDRIDVAASEAWLKSNFPEVKPYDGTKIIFSPLVGGGQSLTYFESNGYRELQPHVNFVYAQAQDEQLTPTNAALRRGMILFTEMNHGFINPTAERHAQEVNASFASRDVWAKEGSPSDAYQGAMMLFNEYMNWALISLYFNDRADPENLQGMINGVENQMVNGRGFTQFREFNQHLLKLYRERPAGTPLAALYPQILEWSRQRQAGVKGATQ